MTGPFRFSDADLESVRAAVHAAEGNTSGEIVPYVAGRSSRYAFAVWRAAAACAALGMGVHLAWSTWLAGWGSALLHTPAAVALAALVSGALGALAVARVPALTRLAAGRAAMTRAVHSRAREAFLDEEVFDTRDRTGILLYVSLLEHRIEVVGDRGIHQRVDDDAWIEVVELVRDGIRAGRPVDGLVAGITRCGALLQERGVSIRPDDDNELSDRLRIDPGV